ncbi:glycosyltransferase family 9 protein [Rosenbergiella sp. S61]|uniref:Glycosyltransferase family 9 protein n=1 Tax=Rosenbergiella gaditana TaxID=2726987 RepID=A0ABS5SSR3_9GAMM|nr:glycosyltransferase family 9 protein [Rosenbergiella gaditana]MBT0723110.1 glycosyltransferase family 9 protein [Rosenbergiella gaditana]
MSILRNLAFRFFDYKPQPLVAKNIHTVVLHIPDQIGDAMATYPLIRSLEKQQIAHLIIIASTLNHHVFEALTLSNTRLTVMTTQFQDVARYSEIKALAQQIRAEYGTPDLCIEAMRKKNLKTLLFVNTLRAKANLQAVGLKMRCFSPYCRIASRMDQKFRAPVPMTWSILMREAGFPVVEAGFELPIPEATSREVDSEINALGPYIALNLEGSVAERTFSPAAADQLLSLIQQVTPLPVVIVHSPKMSEQTKKRVAEWQNIYILSLEPSILRSAAVVRNAFLTISPDTSIVHMASAYKVPVLAIYSNFKTRWPPMQTLAETVVVGREISHFHAVEFSEKLQRLITRISA